MRAISPTASVRLGVFGNLSATNSASAPAVNKIATGSEPTHDSGDCRLNRPKWAAHAVTAGAVIDRSPASTPIKNVRIRTYSVFMTLDLALAPLLCQDRK